jgi:NADPH2:quinone reductase
LLVQTAAIGVNFIDVYRRSGVYRMPFPHIPGSEGAGTIVALGAGVGQDADFAVGQRVAWADSVSGSYAPLVRVAAERALPVPDGLDPLAAAALPLQGMTADYLVHSTFPVGPGDTTVLYAAAGGVGLLASQMILAAGGRLIPAVGTQAKAHLLERLGVPPSDVMILGTMRDLTADIPELVRELTEAAGADVVYDSIGQATFKASLASLRRRGTLVAFGGSSGQIPPFDIQELNAHGSLYLTRPTLADYTATRAELLERAERVFDAALNGELAVTIGERFPLLDAAQAHTALESRATTGKILLIP